MQKMQNGKIANNHIRKQCNGHGIVHNGLTKHQVVQCGIHLQSIEDGQCGHGIHGRDQRAKQEAINDAQLDTKDARECQHVNTGGNDNGRYGRSNERKQDDTANIVEKVLLLQRVTRLENDGRQQNLEKERGIHLSQRRQFKAWNDANDDTDGHTDQYDTDTLGEPVNVEAQQEENDDDTDGQQKEEHEEAECTLLLIIGTQWVGLTQNVHALSNGGTAWVDNVVGSFRRSSKSGLCSNDGVKTGKEENDNVSES